MSNYTVNAYTSDPGQLANAAELAAALASEESGAVEGRARARALASTAIARGYWVEVFNADGELVGGPFDPDQPQPAYLF